MSVLAKRRQAWRRASIPGEGKPGPCNFINGLCYIPVLYHNLGVEAWFLILHANWGP